MERPLKIFGLVCIAYLLCAQLASLLPFSSGLAVPIWPAAGVALAAVLLYGNVAVLAVFSAELLFLWLNAGIDFVWLDALVISMTVALQPLLGATLVRRLAGYPSPLSTTPDVLRFLFWGGLIATMLGACVGSWVLWQQGEDGASTLLFNGIGWWFADASGVFLVTPVLLAWLSPITADWRSRRWSMTLPVIIAIGFLTLLIGSSRYLEQQRLQGLFEKDSRAQYQQLTDAFDEQANLLHTLRDFFQASPAVDPQQFRAFVGPLLARTPQVRSLSWNSLVAWRQRPGFEREMRQQGYSVFHILERDKHGKLRIAAQRNQYVVVTHIEPLADNQQFLGYDLYSSPERKAILDRSRQTGRISAGRLQVSGSGGNNRVGLVLTLPVTGPDDPKVPGAPLRGYVTSELRLGYLLQQLLDEGLPVGLRYRLADVNSAVQGEWLGSSPLLNSGGVLSQRFAFEFAERDWVFELVADSNYLAANRHMSSWLVLALGLLVACLVGGFTTLLTGRNQQTRLMLKRQSEAIRDREARLRLTQFAVDHMKVGVYLIDQQARLVYVNDTACRELGYQHDELIGKELADLNPGFERLGWSDHWQRLEQEQELRFETRHRTKQGGEIAVEVFANYFEYDGVPYNLAFIRDISTRQKRRKELRQLSAAIEQSPVSVVITDLDGVVEYVNSAFLRVSGYSREEVLGKKPHVLQSGYTSPQQDAEMWKVLRSGGSWFGEFRNKRKDGSLFWESASITPVLDEEGKPTHYLSVKEDVTDSRADRDRLRRSEKMLQRAQALAHIGSWELDFMTGRLRWSDETCRIFGIEPGTTLDYQGYLDFVHPDDQERLDDAWLAALEGEAYDIQHRIRVGEQVKTVHQRAEFEFDEEGAVLRGVGTFHDITHQQEAEAALQQSERRYRSLVTALTEGVVLRSANGQIEAFNPAAQQIMGRTLQMMQEYGPGHEGARIYRENGEPLPWADEPSMMTLSTGKPCRGVVVGLDRSEGERVWLSVNTEPLCHPGEHKPYAVVISFQDISGRLQAEQELRQLATTDALTGLLNRRSSTLLIEQELALCKRLSSHQSALLLMDIDYFKSVNDRYGHAAGDQALVHLADVIRSTRREIDMAGRWGGEEFVMLLPGTDLEGARAYAERLRLQLADQSIEYEGVSITITVSIGVVLLDPEEEQADAALQRVDKLMYAAKSRGRNRVVAGMDATSLAASDSASAVLPAPVEQDDS